MQTVGLSTGFVAFLYLYTNGSSYSEWHAVSVVSLVCDVAS